MADQVLSIIVPVKDEADTLSELIASVEESEVPGFQKQILVVDDGSTDETPRLLDSYRGREGFVVLTHPTNRGKGAAIRTAIPHVAGRIVLIQDADQEYDPADYCGLLEPILAGSTRVVYGSRFLGRATGMALPNLVANRLLSLTATAIGPSHVTDEATCYKVFTTDVLRSLPLRCEGFEFCAEVTGLLQAAGEPIVEVPITYRARRRDKGKKVRASDGFLAVWWMLWSRFGRTGEKAAAREASREVASTP